MEPNDIAIHSQTTCEKRNTSRQGKITIFRQSKINSINLFSNPPPLMTLEMGDKEHPKTGLNRVFLKKSLFNICMLQNNLVIYHDEKMYISSILHDLHYLRHSKRGHFMFLHNHIALTLENRLFSVHAYP